MASYQVYLAVDFAIVPEHELLSMIWHEKGAFAAKGAGRGGGGGVSGGSLQGWCLLVNLRYLRAPHLDWAP